MKSGSTGINIKVLKDLKEDPKDSAPRVSQPSKDGVVAKLEEANQIILEAKRQAEEIVRQAKEEYNLAKEKGYEAGVIAGKATIADQATSLLKDSQKINTFILEQSKSIAFALAKKILKQELKQNNEILIKLIKESFDKLPKGVEIELYVNREDQENIADILPEIQLHAGRSKITVFIDQSIEIGGVKLITKAGEIDATIDTILNNLKKNLEASGDS